MHIVKNDITEACTDHQAMIEADRFASEMDDVLLNIEDLDPVACPPDQRYHLGDQEAWVYEHGNICELVFVRV